MAFFGRMDSYHGDQIQPQDIEDDNTSQNTDSGEDQVEQHTVVTHNQGSWLTQEEYDLMKEKGFLQKLK